MVGAVEEDRVVGQVFLGGSFYGVLFCQSSDVVSCALEERIESVGFVAPADESVVEEGYEALSLFLLGAEGVYSVSVSEDEACQHAGWMD